MTKKILSFILVLLLFTGCKSGYKGLDKPLENTDWNATVISDGGIAAQKGDFIYYINGDNFTRHENERFDTFTGALCRAREDGSDKSVVVDQDVSLFNIKDDRIYLVFYSKKGSQLASVKLDGTDFKIITVIDDIYYGGCYGFTQKAIYYTKDFCLYRYDFQKSHKVTDFEIFNLTVGEDYTYFTRDLDGDIGNVYKLKTGSDTAVEITREAGYVVENSGSRAYYYILANGKLYEYDALSGTSEAVVYGGYSDYVIFEDGYVVSYSLETENDENLGIFIVKKEGGNKIKLSSSQGTSMVIVGDYLYYVNVSKVNMLYRVKLDGTEEECVSEEYVYHYMPIDVVGEYIYYYSDSDYDRIYRLNVSTLQGECFEYEDIAIVG